MTIQIDLKRNSGAPSLGTHLFKVTKITEQMDTPSGFPNIMLQCTCQDKGPDQGKQVLLNVSMSPAAEWKRDEILDAMGFPQEGKIVSDAFMGKMFRANVLIQDVNGKERAGLDNFMPYAGGSPAQTSLPMKAPAPVKSGLPARGAKVEEPPF